MPETTTIYPAAAIHTLDPSRPSAEAVAVSDGRVLAVGTMDELLTIDGAVVDGPAQRPLDPRQVTVADGSITLA